MMKIDYTTEAFNHKRPEHVSSDSLMSVEASNLRCLDSDGSLVRAFT